MCHETMKFRCKSMDILCYPSRSTDIHGFPWISMDLLVYPCIYMDRRDRSSIQLLTPLPGGALKDCVAQRSADKVRFSIKVSK